MSTQALPAPPFVLSRYRFAALGVVWSAYLVAFLSRLCVGPCVFSLIVGHTGGYSLAWWAMVLSAIIAAVFFALVRERRAE